MIGADRLLIESNTAAKVQSRQRLVDDGTTPADSLQANALTLRNNPISDVIVEGTFCETAFGTNLPGGKVWIIQRCRAGRDLGVQQY